MNRRDFTRGLLSLTALPKLPVPALAAGSGTAAAASTTASASASHMYFMGWYTARTSKAVSPDMLAAKLKVSPDVAREIFGKLVANRTVSPPDALGLSRAIDPLPKIRSATGRGAQAVRDKMGEVVQKVKEQAAEALDADAEQTEQEMPETVAPPAPLPHDDTHDTRE